MICSSEQIFIWWACYRWAGLRDSERRATLRIFALRSIKGMGDDEAALWKEGMQRYS